MKRPVTWLLGFVIGCGGFGCEGDLVDDITHRPADAGLADADDRPLRIAPRRPPPIGGGGLARVGDRVVVADADRERVVVVDLARGLALDAHPLPAPGRVAADEGRAYVAVRGGVAVVALERGRLDAVWPVCPSPRGLAVDGATVHVACLGGSLVTLERETGAVIGRRWLEPDLRDVVVVGDSLWISRFRTAEILVVRGEEVARLSAPIRRVDGVEWQGRVGWRLRRLPDGGVMLLHQWHRLGPVGDAYGRETTDCDAGRVVPGTTVYRADADGGRALRSAAIGGAVLVVDFAVDGEWIGLATPGERDAHDPYAAPPLDRADLPLRRVPIGALTAEEAASRRCVAVRAGGHGRTRPVAVAAGPDGLVYFGRHDGLVHADAERPLLPWLGGASVADTAHDLFHIDAGGGITCANCHPEGGDDGHTWQTAADGPRRTLSLYGGSRETAPHHWDGSLRDLATLIVAVRGRLMGGGPLSAERIDALADWLDGLDVPPFATLDPLGLAADGEHAFGELGCAGCHRPPLYTDNRSHRVGSESIQTPSLLGVGLRNGLGHRGCAAGLAGRFAGEQQPCGDALHPPVDPARLPALLEFLSTL